MMIMRTSPRVLKATEKYIASLGRKREELTEEQWNFMVNYIKGRRLGNPFLLIFCLFCAVMAFAYWHLGKRYAIYVIPQHEVKISFNDQREPIFLSPEEIRQYFKHATHCYAMAWGQFLLAILFFTFFVVSLTAAKITNRKAHRILLSRPTTMEVET